MSNHFHKALADKFNKKKTINNDISRISNIHKKTNYHLHIIKDNQINNINNELIKSTETIFQFDSINISTNLNMNTSRDYNIHKIPKILHKEIIIPNYSPNDNFNLNTINQTISTPIHMDIFASDTINEGDINRLKKKHVKKIYHIYQEKYMDNYNPTGFGDFIRSCFFIIQFCVKYGFEYEIIINHPISIFLKNCLSNKFLIRPFNNIHMFTDTNWVESTFDNKNNITQFILSKQKYNSYIDYLCTLPVFNHSILNYNILFPTSDISPNEIQIMESLLEPSREIVDYIEQTMTKLELIKKSFIVLHIRSGDSYLKGENKIFDSLYFGAIKNEISDIIINNNIDVLIIADNNEIKYLLHDIFPSFKYYIKDITHLGEGIKLEREKTKNTLLDFYLMSYSTNIYSLTSYPHGSGFSYWCSKVYNIPYNCKYINIK